MGLVKRQNSIRISFRDSLKILTSWLVSIDHVLLDNVLVRMLLVICQKPLDGGGEQLAHLGLGLLAQGAHKVDIPYLRVSRSETSK